MNNVSISWHKSYFYFDKQGHLNSKKLNLFQRMFRQLGCYSETRLAAIAEIAQAKCFRADPSYTPQQKATLISIIKKAQSKSKCNWIKLGSKDFKEGQHVEYYANISHYNHDDIDFSFRVHLKDSKGQKREATIRLVLKYLHEKNSPYKLSVRQLYEFYPFYDDHLFICDKNDLLAKVTYLFLTKLVVDTTQLPHMNMTDTSMNGKALLAQKYG